ncbi:MAG: septation protein SpoVG family protein [Deltaproteobacteria bacterium]
MAELQVVRLYRFEGDSKLKAFCDVSVGDFVVKGLRVMEGKNGLFLGMPQEKAKDGKWYNVFFPATPEAKKDLTQLVFDAYEK